MIHSAYTYLHKCEVAICGTDTKSTSPLQVNKYAAQWGPYCM